VSTPRRGWRETIEQGTYRTHRVACPSSADQRPGRRCGCPLQILVPGAAPGSSRMLTFDGSLTQARAERRRLMAEGRPRQPIEPDAAILHNLAVHWFRAGASRWSPGTLALRDHSYRSRIAPRWAATKLDEINRPAVEAWATGLIAEGVGRRAVETAVQTLRAMLATALDAGMIATNPAARVRLPPAPPAERTVGDRVIDRDGIELLLAACGDDVRQRTIIRAMAEAGLRRSEVAGLTWADVHLESRRLVIRQAIYQNARVGKMVRQPKAGKLGRVAISASFVSELSAWYALSVIERGGAADGWVWPGRRGEAMSPSSVSHLVGRIGRNAGLVDAKGRHVAHAHGLRHSAGSIALSDGVPITVVSSQLRHSRPAFTLQRYSHLLGDAELDRFATAVDAGTLRETLRGNREEAEKREGKAISD